MKVHAKRKAILEVTFAEEEGHGSGVTSEFYSLVSEALQAGPHQNAIYCREVVSVETNIWFCAAAA